MREDKQVLDPQEYLQGIIDKFHHVDTLRNGEQLVFKDGDWSNRSYLFAKAATGQAIDDVRFDATLDRIYYRRDCTDFDVNVLIRMLYLYSESGVISDNMLAELKEVLLDYDYWFHKNNKRPGNQIIWTENHVFQYLTAEFLAARLYPEEVFRMREMTGAEILPIIRKKVLNYIELKAKTGFCEWDSNVYADENFFALLNLYDFAGDEAIVIPASELLEVMFVQMAVSSYKGCYGSTHGRTYDRHIISSTNDNTADLQKLAWGLGGPGVKGSVSGLAYATSTYRVSQRVRRIAHSKEVIETKQQQSFDVEDGPSLGFGYDDEEDLTNYWHNMGYSHRLILKNNIAMEKKYNLWLNEWTYFEYRHMQRCEEAGLEVPKCRCSNYLSRINSLTYKTPDFMLSCAQNFRKGELGYQQHIWQATLDGEAVVFTNHPGLTERPGFWAGNEILPKAVQYKDTLIAIYDIREAQGYSYTHAHFPREAFDEVVEVKGWMFARKNDGYIGLFSQNGYRREVKPGDVPREVLCLAQQNIWLCQMGRAADYGSFNAFVERVTGGQMIFDGMNVSYASPRSERIEVGYDRPLRVDGLEVAVDGYKRIENDFISSDYGSGVYRISEGHEEIEIDFMKEKSFV